MSKRKPAKKRSPNQIDAKASPGEDETACIARTVMRPTVQAAVTVKEYTKSLGDLDLSGLIGELAAQTEAVNAGDLGRAEAMLSAQAHTLDAIFNSLARRAINAEYMDNLDRYLKLALRAQSQCRANCEALAAIKNPPLAGYVRQANIAHNQQVNNGSRAQGNEIKQNKLLEQTDGERLDTGTTSTTSGVDSHLEAVEASHRAENGWGKGQGEPERLQGRDEAVVANIGEVVEGATGRV